jgi:glycosyltransferase involved in cell wall biosynthesis
MQSDETGTTEDTQKRHVAVLSIHALYDTRITNHIRTLAAAGHRVTYINMSCIGKLTDPDIIDSINLIRREQSPVVGINPLSLRRLHQWFFDQARQTNADLFHIHDPLLLPLIPKLCALQRPVVFDAHEHYTRFPGLLGTVYRWWYRTKLPSASAVVGVSDSTVPAIDAPSIVVPNYQSSRDFDAATNQGVNETIRVTYFGDLHTENRDVAGMIDIAKHVLASRDDVSFSIGGKLGGPEYDRLLAMFNELHERHGDRFRWLGIMERQQVVDETANADIGMLLLSPMCMNIEGASPNKVFEYLACGAAMLCTDCFVIADRIRDRAGVLFPVGVDAKTVANTIIELAADRIQLAEMKAASAEIGQDYKWESVAPRYLELYERVLG